MSDDLPERVSALESQVDAIDKRVERWEGLALRLQNELADMRHDFRGDISDLKKSALEAMPPWAARAMSRDRFWVGVLVSLLGISLTIALWVIFHTTA